MPTRVAVRVVGRRKRGKQPYSSREPDITTKSDLGGQMGAPAMRAQRATVRATVGGRVACEQVNCKEKRACGPLVLKGPCVA
eukprot:6424916-Pyramimonas_sp.AAC.1